MKTDAKNTSAIYVDAASLMPESPLLKAITSGAWAGVLASIFSESVAPVLRTAVEKIPEYFHRAVDSMRGQEYFPRNLGSLSDAAAPTASHSVVVGAAGSTKKYELAFIGGVAAIGAAVGFYNAYRRNHARAELTDALHAQTGGTVQGR